jgi:drug/metabolite transporter (DMT)-like permease
LPPAAVRLLLVLLFVIWSNAFTAIKHLRSVFEPMELVAARFLPVAVFCLIAIVASEKKRKAGIEILRSAPLQIAVMGMCSVAGYNYFLFLGQSEVKPGAAALLTTLSPLFTLILAIAFLGERVPKRRVLGIFIAFAGLFFVVRWGSVGLGSVTGVTYAEVRYALITVLAPLSWSIYTILGKDLVKVKSPVTITFITLIIGTLPFLFVLGGDFMRAVHNMEITHWIALAHLSILCTIIGFWIWITALKYMPATSVASFIYLNPPFAALFGWLFFGEEITLLFLAGSAVVLSGLYLAQSKNRG